ncbi:MAG: bifunctional oligoribonuclease/PAP phosphatase NrnA [bacterium]
MVRNLNSTGFLLADITRAWDLITRAQKITLLTHSKPDADGVSACTALSLLLEKYGKQTETIYPDKPDMVIQYQPKHVLVGEHSFVPDLIIICDTANCERVYWPEAFNNCASINIDHHISNSINSTVNFVSEKVASTCEHVYELICAWDYDAFDRQIAQSLLLGILYDSQVFHTRATNARTLRIAADLIDFGANMIELQAQLLQNKNPKIIEFWGYLLSSIKLSPSGRAAWSIIKQCDLQARGLTAMSLVGFINFLSQISDLDISAIFYETEEGWTKVSLRSKITDVNALSQRFGGGGHKNAAGIMIKKNIDDVVLDVTSCF